VSIIALFTSLYLTEPECLAKIKIALRHDEHIGKFTISSIGLEVLYVDKQLKFDAIATMTPDLRLPSQPEGIIALRPVPVYKIY